MGEPEGLGHGDHRHAPADRGVVIGSLIVASVFVATNLPAIAIWAGLGVQVPRCLGSARRLRIFNVTMAILLMLSLWPLLSHG